MDDIWIYIYIYHLVDGDERNMSGWFSHILGMSTSQLTDSYFSEGLKYHQPVSYWECPFIVEFPIHNGDVPQLCWITRGYMCFSVFCAQLITLAFNRYPIASILIDIYEYVCICLLYGISTHLHDPIICIRFAWVTLQFRILKHSSKTWSTRLGSQAQGSRPKIIGVYSI